MFTRLPKVEIPLNDPKKQVSFAQRRNVVVFTCKMAKVKQNAWEPRVETDIRPFATAAMQRMVETAKAVVRHDVVIHD